ncbi:2-dehydro-3-deoxygluconokinase [Skermanella aerolata]|uniref:2-dehydro-3-deoxygluconokinase n=1 Tax=Skermanella aerolata TaxID=393310 RepID=A0A512DHE4_9PROT|nr:sugar kinase [Skermanella aerolata]KJB94078.1 ketodeoxygluconokinase [Skermanella aerolata KACC 11604]GEO35903.1 2-dehydro-3-deoxygluconokinase [Skermanella aerolata]
MVRVACIGECMIELSEHADGSLTRSYGGDTLNTALYMARLGTPVDYVTALGDDGWSDEMLAAWKAEGIGTSKVLRLSGRLPGLYVIQTDASGERRFQYWRDSAAARDLFALEKTPALIEALARDYSLLYLSGITLSLYGEKGRAVLSDALDKARAAGVRIAFDTNFRTRGWPERDVARQAYRDILSRSDIALASTEDLDLLFGEGGTETFLEGQRPAEVVLKLAEPACRVMVDGSDDLVEAKPVERVVDTTAAGDSFAAAYLTARLSGANPVDAARAGHRLAGAVVGYRGAIIPRSAMPSDVLKREGLV